MIRRQRDFVLVGVALFVGFVVPGVLRGQPPSTAPVSIRLTDPAGAAIAKVPIRIVPSPDPASGKMETDEKGQVALDLKPGGYALFVEFAGFKPVATHIEVQGIKEVQIIPVRLEHRRAHQRSCQPHRGMIYAFRHIRTTWTCF